MTADTLGVRPGRLGWVQSMLGAASAEMPCAICHLLVQPLIVLAICWFWPFPAALGGYAAFFIAAGVRYEIELKSPLTYVY